MSELEKTIDIVDTSIKRLTTPTLIIVAAAMVSRGLKQPNADVNVIYGVMTLLLISAFCVMASSAAVALNNISELQYGDIRKFPLMLAFVLTYFLLFAAGVAIALSKLYVG